MVKQGRADQRKCDRQKCDRPGRNVTNNSVQFYSFYVMPVWSGSTALALGPWSGVALDKNWINNDPAATREDWKEKTKSEQAESHLV